MHTVHLMKCVDYIKGQWWSRVGYAKWWSRAGCDENLGLWPYFNYSFQDNFLKSLTLFVFALYFCSRAATLICPDFLSQHWNYPVFKLGALIVTFKVPWFYVLNALKIRNRACSVGSVPMVLVKTNCLTSPTSHDFALLFWQEHASIFGLDLLAAQFCRTYYITHVH